MNIADLLAESERLRAENQQLRFEKAALEKRVARLEAELQALKELLEKAQRRGKRRRARAMLAADGRMSRAAPAPR